MSGKKGTIPWNKGLTKETDPRVLKNAESLKGNQPMLGKHHSKEAKRRIGDAQRGTKNHRFGARYSDEEKALFRQKTLELAKDLQYITKLRQASLKLWQDPEWVRQMMLARQAKPNKLEQRLIKILAEHFPEYKYNGDFSQGVLLGGLTPDFVNVNGKKKVIELFGTFFHTGERATSWKRTELGKIMVYNSLGFECLVIWDYETQDEGELLEKIRAFTKRRVKHASR